MTNKNLLLYRKGFLGGANGKEPGCQCKRHKRRGFDPWVGKIPGEGIRAFPASTQFRYGLLPLPFTSVFFGPVLPHSFPVLASAYSPTLHLTDPQVFLPLILPYPWQTSCFPVVVIQSLSHFSLQPHGL